MSERLHYLGRYTTGESQGASSSILLLKAVDTYKQVKKILSDRFENPPLIADAYRKKINQWPKSPANNGMSLRKFSDFLVHCKAATSTVKCPKVLDNPDLNQMMVCKFPGYLIECWSMKLTLGLTRLKNNDTVKEHHVV